MPFVEEVGKLLRRTERHTAEYRRTTLSDGRASEQNAMRPIIIKNSPEKRKKSSGRDCMEESYGRITRITTQKGAITVGDKTHSVES